MFRFHAALAYCTLVVLTACSSDDGQSGKTSSPIDRHFGQFARGSDISIPSVSNRLSYDSSVPQSQKQGLDEAFSSLFVNPITSNGDEVRRLLGTPDTAPTTLQKWVEDRVQYILGEKFDFDSRLKEVSSSHAYENPNLLPDGFSSSRLDPQPVSKGTVVMSNMGTAIYATGKKFRLLLGVEVAGHGVIPVTSPRTGILQIGPGLFETPIDLQNLAYAIDRVSTLFHEARHSDGNGKSLGFLHVKCPSYHDYAGQAACDSNANGPYTVNSVVLKALSQSCEKCEARSREYLRLALADVSHRRVSWTDWDERHEGSR